MARPAHFPSQSAPVLTTDQFAWLLGPYEAAYRRQLQRSDSVSAAMAARSYAIHRRSPLQMPDARLDAALLIASHRPTYGEIMTHYGIGRSAVRDWVTLIAAPLADALDLTVSIPPATVALLLDGLDAVLASENLRQRGASGRFVRTSRLQTPEQPW